MFLDFKNARKRLKNEGPVYICNSTFRRFSAFNYCIVSQKKTRHSIHVDREILIDFQNSFTARLSTKFATK